MASRGEPSLVEDRARLMSLVPAWEALLACSRSDPTFASPHWYLAALASTGSAPRLVLAHHQGRLRGVLPLCAGPASDAWTFAGSLADYHHAVVEAGDVETACVLLLHAAALQPRLRLDRLRPESELVQAWHALEPDRRPVGRLVAGAEHRVVSPGVSDEAYLASRSRSFRRGLRRARSRAAAAGLRIELATPSSLPATALPELFEHLHLARHGPQSTFTRPDHASFSRAMLPALYTRGHVRPLVLIHGDRIVAIELCLEGHDRLCAWNTGFLPEVAGFAPGRLLMDAALQRVRAEGKSSYDLLRGSWSYKQEWTDDCSSTVTLELGPADPLSPP